jgi:hypothetical protein
MTFNTLHAANTRLEIKAEAFRLDTGMMAPFKDDPSGDHSEEERLLEWCTWGKANEAHFQKFIHAADRVLSA